MEVNQQIIDYINSEQFNLDTMLHYEGNKYIYLEAIPANKKKKMFWLNGHLMNCKHMIKHVGSFEQILDLLAKKLNITKIDVEKTKNRDDGGWSATREYVALMDKISDCPKVIASPRFIYKEENEI